VGKTERKNHFEGPGIDERMILDGSSGSGTWVYGLDRCGSGQGQVADNCACGNEPSDSIKCGELVN
jgi:hypothetical protein